MRDTLIICLLLSLFIPEALKGQTEKNLDSLLVDAAKAIEDGKYETGFDLFLQCLSKAEKEDRADRLPAIYSHLGLIQQYNKVYDKSLDYFKKAA